MRCYADEIEEFKRVVQPYLHIAKSDPWDSACQVIHDLPRNVVVLRLRFISTEFARIYYEAWKNRLFFIPMDDMDAAFYLYVVQGNLKATTHTECSRAFEEWMREKGYL